jgi:hypothetical protein
MRGKINNKSKLFSNTPEQNMQRVLKSRAFNYYGKDN